MGMISRWIAPASAALGLVGRVTVRVAIVALAWASVAAPAGAGFLALDNSTQTIARPASGSLTVTVTGKLAFDPGYFGTPSDQIVRNLFDLAGDQLITTLAVSTPSAAYNGGTYSGPLFTFVVSSSTPIGTYFLNSDTNTNPILSESATNSSTGLRETYNVPFSVTITPSTVPEPSSIALCGVAGVAFAVVARSRRRRLV